MHDLILKTLSEAEKPMRAAEIAKILGVDSKKVYRILDALRDEGKVISPKYCYYKTA